MTAAIIICGDMNSRKGQLSDSISMLDKIPRRNAIYKTTNEHGINLLCTVSKLYSSVLNNRLLPYLENNSLLVDEQSVFRSYRS